MACLRTSGTLVPAGIVTCTAAGVEALVGVPAAELVCAAASGVSSSSIIPKRMKVSLAQVYGPTQVNFVSRMRARAKKDVRLFCAQVLQNVAHELGLQSLGAHLAADVEGPLFFRNLF